MRVVIRDGIRPAHHAELAVLVEEAFVGIETSGVEVHVEPATRSRDSFTGRAYGGRPARPRSDPDTRFLVRLKVPRVIRNRAYPKTYRYPGRKTAPEITVRNWQERLVALAAHEAFHVRQFREGLRRSEILAERWAAERLASWCVNGGSVEAPGRAAPAIRAGVQATLFDPAG
jgi:hypothetical protein